MDRYDLILTALLVLLIACGLIAGFMIGILYSENQEIFSGTPNSYMDCANKSLTITASCLSKYVNTFYAYNISQSGKKLNINEIKQAGAVCQQYAELYSDMGSKLGFYTENTTMIVKVNKTVTQLHEISIMSNKEGWCYFDLDEYACPTRFKQ